MLYKTYSVVFPSGTKPNLPFVHTRGWLDVEVVTTGDLTSDLALAKKRVDDMFGTDCVPLLADEVNALPWRIYTRGKLGTVLV